MSDEAVKPVLKFPTERVKAPADKPLFHEPTELEELRGILVSMRRAKNSREALTAVKDDAQIEKEVDEGLAIEAKRGCYDNADQAFGGKLQTYLSDEASSEIGQDSEIPQYKRLATHWTEGKVRVVPDKETGETKFFIERTLEGGRKAYVLAKPNGIEKDSDIYNVETMVFQGIDGKCVNFMERIPKDVMVKINVGDYKTPNDAIHAKSLNYYYSPSAKEIHFDHIKSFIDVASLFHEAGHAVDDTTLSPEEKKQGSTARFISKTVREGWGSGDLKIVKMIEDKMGMTFEKARQIVAREEIIASQWAKGELEMLRDQLGLEPSLATKVCETFEEYWQTYDQFTLPDVSASRLGRENPNITAAWAHVANYEQLASLVKEYGLEENNSLVLNLNGLKVNITHGMYGTIGVFLISENKTDPSISTIISPYYCTVKKSDTMADGLIDEVARLELYDPKSLAESTNAVTALDAEKQVEKILTEGLDFRQGELNDYIVWLKETFRRYLPNIDEIDPLNRVANIEQTSERVLSKYLASRYDVATPKRRFDVLCRELMWRIAEDFQLDPNRYLEVNYNSWNGEKANDWTRLVSLCQEAVVNDFDNEIEVPDLNFSQDRKTDERRIVALATHSLARFKAQQAA